MNVEKKEPYHIIMCKEKKECKFYFKKMPHFLLDQIDLKLGSVMRSMLTNGMEQ